MYLADKGSTCPALLGRGGDWTDHDAWVELFERYDDLIRHCCDRLGLIGADADEVRRETRIEVAERLPRSRSDPRGSFRASLRVVCRNKAISFLRRDDRRRNACLDDASAIAPAAPDAFWLAAVYEWEIDQVASQLGLARAAVYKAVQRIRDRLRDEGAQQSRSLTTAR